MNWGLFLSFISTIQIATALPTATEMDAYIKSQNEFSLSLYSCLDQEQNLIYSPFSIFSSLSMIYLGTREESALEMEKALYLKFPQNKIPPLAFTLNKMILPAPSEEETFQLTLANGLWVNKDSFILSDYRHALQEDFNAQASELDFSKSDEAIQIINEWTANTTEDKILNLLQKGDIDKSTRLVITNALFFKGAWSSPFEPEKTREANFYPIPKTPIVVSMMEQTASFPYFENELFQMVALPFQGLTAKNSQICCLFILPKEEISPIEFNKALTASALHRWIEQLSLSLIKIAIPRFTFTQRIPLNETLQRMGMLLPFTEKANFSGINGMRNLFLNQVIHQAYFSLNEAGVTAAAATAGSIGLTAMPEQKAPAFIANRPFLFFIIDMKTELPLFMGKCVHPR